MPSRSHKGVRRDTGLYLYPHYLEQGDLARDVFGDETADHPLRKAIDGYQAENASRTAELHHINHINVLFNLPFGAGVIDHERQLIADLMETTDQLEACKSLVYTAYCIYARDSHFRSRSEPYEERTIKEGAKLHFLMLRSLREVGRKMNCLRTEGRLTPSLEWQVVTLPHDIWTASLKEAYLLIAALNAEMDALHDFFPKADDPPMDWFSLEAYAAGATEMKRRQMSFEEKLFRSFGDLNTVQPDVPDDKLVEDSST